MEENNKFVFKYALKYLRHQFYIRNGLIKSPANELLFYKHYFGECAVRNKTPLEHYFDPLYRASNKNPKHKSINSKYLEFVLDSAVFKDDFFAFLQTHFYNTHLSNINSKIRKFLKKLRGDLLASRSDELSNVLIERFVDKLRKNKKCKLPWTTVEVDSALAQFKSLIQYH